jgi:hypothetical protein
MRGSGAGYVAGFENFSALTNANGLNVKILSTNALSRILSLNAGGSDLVTVTANGYMTAQAYSVGANTIADTVGNVYGHSLSIFGVAAQRAGTTVPSIDYQGAITVGNPTFGKQAVFAQSAGAFNNGTDYSTIVALLGPLATSGRVVEEYFHPYAIDGLARESAVSIGVINSYGDTNWETNGITSRVVNNSPVTNGVAGAFWALSNVRGGKVWAHNWFLRDYQENPLGGLYAPVTHYPSILKGVEIDLACADFGSQATGLNIGISFPILPRSSYAVPGQLVAGLWNSPGFTAISVDCTNAPNITNYFDYAYFTADGAATTGLHLGIGSAGTTAGQFIDLISGTSGGTVGVNNFMTRMFNGGSGNFAILANNGANVNYVRVKTTGQLQVDGSSTAGVWGAGILLTNGWMEADDAGFRSSSAYGNAVSLPNGGMTSLTATINSTLSNALQLPNGGGIVTAGPISCGALYPTTITASGVITANAGINAGNQGITCGAINPYGGFIGQGLSTSEMQLHFTGGFGVSYTGTTPPGAATPGTYYTIRIVGGATTSVL